MADIFTYPLGPLETNCHLIINGDRAIAIDPGGDPAKVITHLERGNVKLEAILLTHLHFDHCYGVKDLAEATGAKVYASANDEWLLETELGLGGFMGLPTLEPYEWEPIENGEHDFAGMVCKVLPTPGHTPGGISFYFPELEAVFSGDLVFYRSIGRTDFPQGDQDILLQSAKQQIFTLPSNTVIYSGHGPETSVADESSHSPFFSGMV